VHGKGKKGEQGGVGVFIAFPTKTTHLGFVYGLTGKSLLSNRKGYFPLYVRTKSWNLTFFGMSPMAERRLTSSSPNTSVRTL
jgi:hypothetical protein